MTKLPEKELLSGAKMPRTTTGEMKNALGKLRDYLAELFGDDSTDKEGARQTLGINLSDFASKPDVETALSEKADKDELNALQKEISKRGTPIGSIDYFAMETPPAGYLIADGSAVGRETYPELYAAIGTTYGEGDGQTTFKLPDLINRFAQGSNTPGQKIEAGLPNITGGVGLYNSNNTFGGTNWHDGNYPGSGNSTSYGGQGDAGYVEIDASGPNPIYGASNSVQPPALTLLPCIKAFDAATNPGLIDITELASDLNTKLDKAGGRINGAIYFGETGYTGVGYDEYGQIVLTSKGGTSPASLALGNDGHLWTNSRQIHYVTEANNNGTNWYRKWSDGWLEQGGVNNTSTSGNVTISFLKPYQSTPRVMAFGLEGSATTNWWICGARSPTTLYVTGSVTGYQLGFDWYACGY